MECISLEEYTKAVTHCVGIAQQDTGGSRIMAQVLLSAYNGDAFQLDVAGLGGLDRENYEQAITVIRGRYDVHREPHDVIPNGSAIFRDLWEQWKRLHVKVRGLPSCHDCEGRGRVWVNPDDDDDRQTEECSRCKGLGKVAATQ